MKRMFECLFMLIVAAVATPSPAQAGGHVNGGQQYCNDFQSCWLPSHTVSELYACSDYAVCARRGERRRNGRRRVG